MAFISNHLVLRFMMKHKLFAEFVVEQKVLCFSDAAAADVAVCVCVQIKTRKNSHSKRLHFHKQALLLLPQFKHKKIPRNPLALLACLLVGVSLYRCINVYCAIFSTGCLDTSRYGNNLQLWVCTRV